ncbi:hypothetical protein Q7P36_010313 [Cladosporium allicinum]
MSTTDAQPEAPLATPSLQGLSNEVCLAVIEHFDMSSFFALSLTSHHFHKLTNLKEDGKKDRKDGFACSICLKLLPRIEFTETQTKGPRGRNGGRFCSICFICTDCVRRHSRRNHGWRPCEERPFHSIIGDELPPAEESQAVTAFQISSHPSLSLAGLSMSDYEAKTGESASPECLTGNTLPLANLTKPAVPITDCTVSTHLTNPTLPPLFQQPTPPTNNKQTRPPPNLPPLLQPPRLQTTQHTKPLPLPPSTPPILVLSKLINKPAPRKDPNTDETSEPVPPPPGEILRFDEESV